MRIFLTGFMGTGKTAVGKLLAQNFGLEFIDLDEVIVLDQGKSINDIFAKQGEDFFRDVETKCLKEVVSKDNIVLSTGGGVVIKKENRDLLKSQGKVINLNAGAEEIYKRLKHDNTRPLLAVKNPLVKIKEILAEREDFYKEADVVINTDGKSYEEIVKKIRSLL